MIYDDQPQMVEALVNTVEWDSWATPWFTEGGCGSVPEGIKAMFAAINREALIDKIVRARKANGDPRPNTRKSIERDLVAAGILPEHE